MAMQPLPSNPGSSAAGAGRGDDGGGGRGRGRGFGRCLQNGQHRKGQKILGLKELLRLTRELLRGIRQEEVQTSHMRSKLPVGYDPRHREPSYWY